MSQDQPWTDRPRHPDLDFPATIPAFLHDAVTRFGENDLIVTARERHSYRDVEIASRRLAKRLLANGVGKGTRVGTFFPQNLDWVVAFLAAARVGAFVMPFSTFYRPAELHRALQHGDVHTLIIPPRMFSRDVTAFLTEAVEGLEGQRTTALRLPAAPYLRSVLIYGATEGPAWATALSPTERDAADVDDALLAAVEAAVTPADLLVTIYTSGTTSAPKGVVHSHGSQVRHAVQLARGTLLSNKDRVFAGMPFFWVGGLTATLLPVMNTGGAVLCQERFEAGEALDILVGQKATRIIAWPTLQQRLQIHPSFPQRDLSSVAAFPTTGEARHGSLGMTETCGPHTLPPLSELGRALPDELRGSFGAPMAFVRHRIADPFTNATLGEGQVGELCVRGYSLMQGFYKYEREDTFDEDGWYHTGDRAYFKQGYLFFEGRISQMIKSGGSNVSPREVENELELLSNVASAWVFGFPDPEREEVVVAAVLPIGEFDVAQTQATLGKRLSSYKVPRQIIVLSEAEIPLLPTGKADLRAVREIVGSKLER